MPASNTFPTSAPIQVTRRVKRVLPKNYQDTIYYYPNFPIAETIRPIEFERSYNETYLTYVLGQTGKLLVQSIFNDGEVSGVLKLTISKYQLSVVYAHGFNVSEIEQPLIKILGRIYGEFQLEKSN